ncbi:LCP family protein [Nocardia sp. NPDC052566]|uniref:LCP family protein n=1 Tax=Nocardia sp. NPDC052566 TaxID=3364330 RepID=UPI0037C6A47C
MNGDDPDARARRVPPRQGGSGEPGQYRPRPAQGRPGGQPPRPGGPPPRRGAPPPSSEHPPYDPTRTYDLRQPGSQAPPHNSPPPRNPPPPLIKRPTHAPRQEPVPYREEPPRTHAPTQQPVPYHEEPPRRGAPPPPPSLPPKRGQRPPRGERPRRKRHPFRWFLALLLILVLTAIGGLIKLDSSLNRIDALAGYKGRVGDTPGTNWLLVGSDGRAGLTPEQEQELATGGDAGPERTDTIMLVHVPKSGATTLVSLPRDSYVSIPGHGKDKLNAAFAFGGPQLLVQTVEIATGLRIDHYAQIGFAGFAGVVDALGGIELCLDAPINDPLAGINLPAGCQKLSGPEALGFVRTRATPNADLDRVKNQRMFMSALLKKMTQAGTLLNPFRLWPVASDTAKSLKVDEGDHIWNLGSLGWALRGDPVATTVPIGGFTDTDSGNVVLWDKDKASRFFEFLAKDQPIPEDLLTR